MFSVITACIATFVSSKSSIIACFRILIILTLIHLLVVLVLLLGHLLLILQLLLRRVLQIRFGASTRTATTAAATGATAAATTPHRMSPADRQWHNGWLQVIDQALSKFV